MHHVVTVGTSLMTNAQRANLDFQDREAVARWVAADPGAASAELNAMGPYLASGRVSSVYLLCTDTEHAKRCGEALEEYLQGRGIPVEWGPLLRVAPDRDKFYEGLTQLAEAVARYIRRHREAGVAVNATGGFKAETSLAATLGLFMGVPVYYRHETARETVELPPLGLASGPTRAALREIPFPAGRLAGPEFEAWHRRHREAVARLTSSGQVRLLGDEGEPPHGVELTQVGRLLRWWVETFPADGSAP